MKRIITPDFVAPDITYITPEFMDEMQFKTLSLDVDGTISVHHAKHLDSEMRDHLRGICSSGFNMVLSSNAYGPSIDELAEIAYSVDCSVLISAPEIAMPNAKNPKRYRKPASTLIKFAAKITDAAPDEVLHVEDQLLKDIVAANRARAYSLLVPKYGTGGDWRVENLQRPIEKFILRGLGKVSLPRIDDLTAIGPDPYEIESYNPWSQALD